MDKRKLIPIVIGVIVAIAVPVILFVLVPAGDAPANDVINGHNSTPANGDEVPEHNAIRDGKIWVDNYVAGTSAEHYIEIYNANGHAAVFTVGFRIADTLQEGYTRAGSAVAEWVAVDDPRPTIPAHSWYLVPVRLGMPSHAIAPADKWEFWIGVIDQSQTGNVQVELCQRWMIDMAD